MDWPPIRHVGIVVKPRLDGGPRVVRDLIAWLKAREIAPVLDEACAAIEGSGSHRTVTADALPSEVDLIVVLGGDMLAEKSMRAIGQAADALGVPVRVFYTSNAPTSWGGNITPAWRANVEALPFDDASVVLVTWNHGAFGQKDYWHYNVQRALTYQSRLQRSGYTYMWQLAWDRIPGGDPDLTLSGLASPTLEALGQRTGTSPPATGGTK